MLMAIILFFCTFFSMVASHSAITQFSSFLRQTFTRPSLNFNSQRIINENVCDLLSLTKQRQCPQNAIAVEGKINELRELAALYPKECRKSISPGSWRTVWTSVTSQSILGTLFQSTPASILGGLSWQTVSTDKKTAENTVFWKQVGIRMIGLANLTFTESADAYDLAIAGLEFRKNINRITIPESEGKTRSTLDGTDLIWKVISVSENSPLR